MRTAELEKDVKQQDEGTRERGRSEDDRGDWPVFLGGEGQSWHSGSVEALRGAGSPQVRARSAFSCAARRPGESGDGPKEQRWRR